MLAREGQLGTSSSTVTAPDNEENAESALVGVENKEETTKRQVASPNARVTSNDEDAGRSWRPGM